MLADDSRSIHVLSDLLTYPAMSAGGVITVRFLLLRRLLSNTDATVGRVLEPGQSLSDALDSFDASRSRWKNARLQKPSGNRLGPANASLHTAMSKQPVMFPSLHGYQASRLASWRVRMPQMSRT